MAPMTRGALKVMLAALAVMRVALVAHVALVVTRVAQGVGGLVVMVHARGVKLEAMVRPGASVVAPVARGVGAPVVPPVASMRPAAREWRDAEHAPRRREPERGGREDQFAHQGPGRTGRLAQQ